MSFGLPGSGASATSGRTLIAATATAGTVLHTVTANSPDQLVRVYVCNTHSGAVKVSLEWGGTTSPDDLIVQAITNDTGEVLMADWVLLRSGQTLAAFAGTTNVVTARVLVRAVV